MFKMWTDASKEYKEIDLKEKNTILKIFGVSIVRYNALFGDKV